MSSIKVLDKAFVPYISAAAIDEKLAAMAQEINDAYRELNPLFLCILNGSFMFASDLYKKITIPSEITFIKLASYKGTSSSGEVLTAIGLDKDLSGRHLILLEDIIDTGRTLHTFIPQIENDNLASLAIVTLLYKPDANLYPLEIKHIGFEIEDTFVVGYGLDYDGYGRNLPEIYQWKED